MKIETKYAIGQEIWLMAHDQPNKATIIEIQLVQYRGSYRTQYIIMHNKNPERRNEFELFATYEELLAEL